MFLSRLRSTINQKYDSTGVRFQFEKIPIKFQILVACLKFWFRKRYSKVSF